jgi:hypothetical protein
MTPNELIYFIKTHLSISITEDLIFGDIRKIKIELLIDNELISCDYFTFKES